MTKVAVFVGSLRKDSLNKKLAHALEVAAPDGVEFDYIDISKLPLFNQDMENDYPTEAIAIKKQVEAADGVLFVTPEYNRGVPGVLKNAIDWASRPWGHNSFAGKPVGLAGVSGGPTGTTVAQAVLKPTLLFLDMKLLGQPELYVKNGAEVFDENGNAKPEHAEYYQRYMARFTEWVRAEE